MTVKLAASNLPQQDVFANRHIGPSEAEISLMLAKLGVKSLDGLIDQTVPAAIRLSRPLQLDEARSEFEALAELRGYASENRLLRSMIGMGYYDCITPPVIQRNILENPGWYTQYTPYQAEISQGRLEALLNFQTMVADLTGLPLANASLLDEATAAAEAMHMAHAVCRDERSSFFVAKACHPQTIAVVQTRARALGVEVTVGCPGSADFSKGAYFGVLLQYPGTTGSVCNHRDLISRVRAAGTVVIVASDLLALTLLTPPGELGADIAIGSAQRFGVPLGGGGPHAAFMSTRNEYARQMPGRIIGVSKDAQGKPAYRLAIQTREQHIRREKATSNICTAQVLLAVMAGMYAVYHGPHGLRRIGQRVHAMAAVLGEGLRRLGLDVPTSPMFDTISVKLHGGETADAVLDRAVAAGYNLRRIDGQCVGVSCDETTTPQDVPALWRVFAPLAELGFTFDEVLAETDLGYPRELMRTSAYLTHPAFNRYHCEHEMLRYIKRLESRDLSLTTSNIPLGSCTMKLNAVAEMFPISWPEFGRIHPYAPADQMRGYARMFADLERWLAEITGLAAVSLQPNSGAQGEYAGLLTIRGYHESQARSGAPRDVCLIPVSAHGTNPASAVMAGFKVVTVKCDAQGNIDIADLKSKAAEHADRLGALMVTYPSTHGVFEEGIREICAIVHQHGGQVYMDGANMNAQVGLCRPGDIGADVCHLNLHKTFCIPHGGGGPGMGPIAVAKHLAPFLPGNPLCVPQPPSAAFSVPQPPSAAFSVPQPPSAAPASTPSRPDALPASASYRRRLPHIHPGDCPVFVTFSTHQGWVLPETVRARVLEHCVHDHGTKIHLYAVVVMPDHVHLVFTPLKDDRGEPYGLPEIMNGIKGASAHGVNKMLGRKGHVWQRESFDHVLRHSESLETKIEYVCENPVRRGLVRSPDEYQWLWREWVEGEEGQEKKNAAEGGCGTQRDAAEGGCGTAKNAAGAAAVQASNGVQGPVSAAAYGSAGILAISWMYIRMMGAAGLKFATQAAILNANYMAKRLEGHYPILYRGAQGRCAHEFIVDCRPLEHSAGVKVEDIAKRLMDYGFHAPTMSFPVPGTLMIEPTESESLGELDRLCDALIGIREEVRAIEENRADRSDNPLKHAPHTVAAVCATEWSHAYSREQAAFPAPWTREHKFWPHVGRIDNVWGDRNLFCTCPPVG
ncbi:MAG: aminomethyl-transferring glycine dehydrogenase [Planctomycetes bacterium]|nr:aminomethyl-transferring glycine dehydrogenase [Planctomycetota bacterium]